MEEKFELNLKKYAICYFDVLGTKARISNDINNALNNLYAISNSINSSSYFDISGRPIDENLIIRTFTDNFLIAKEIVDENLFTPINMVFCAAMQAIVCSLFEYGILLRGAIVVGNMHIDDVTILGPALLDAYDIESNACIYPRILADQSVIDAIPGAKIQIRKFRNYFFEDYDGAICFNYLLFVSKDYLKNNIDDLISRLESDSTGCKLKDKLKYKWTINYLKDYYECIANDFGD